MRNKILSELNGKMNDLRVREYSFVKKALASKSVESAKKWMDRAVKVAKEHEKIQKQYEEYFSSFERYSQDSSFFK